MRAGPGALPKVSTAELWGRKHLPKALADTLWQPLPFGKMIVFTSDSGLFFPRNIYEEDALPVVTVLASDADASVRLWAAYCLGSLPESQYDQAFKVLEGMLGDSDVGVRKVALMHVGNFGAKARHAIPKVRALLGDQARISTNTTLGMMAADVLSRIDVRYPNKPPGEGS